MEQLNETFDVHLKHFMDEVAQLELNTDQATTAISNLQKFSQCRPPVPEPVPIPEPVPNTRWGKVKAGAWCFWQSETTQVAIKAAGSLGAVGLVVFSTIHRDHVLGRQAFEQAHQRQS